MSYDFDKVVNRRGTSSLKWDVGEDELPMWVADMDFPAAPEILTSLEEKLREGIFGYNVIPDEWHAAYISWWKERHGFSIQKEWLVFCTGVVPAISSAIRKLTTPNEKVLIQTPVYNIFYNSIKNNGRRVLEAPLRYEGHTYSVDFEVLEEGLSDPETSLMILCNPQNPEGKLWDRETLLRVGELCKKHGVTVLADEIHCDLTMPGTSYVPFASVSEVCREISITLVAPTKAFNLAGLQTAAVFASDERLRHKIWRALNTDEVAEPNSFAAAAAVAAFTKGGGWLDELREYVFSNKKRVSEYLKENTPELFVIPSDATYLLWIDAAALPQGGKDFAGFLRKETGLFLTDGRLFGRGGEGFLRMNIACPKGTLEDGLERLKNGVMRYKAFYEH